MVNATPADVDRCGKRSCAASTSNTPSDRSHCHRPRGPRSTRRPPARLRVVLRKSGRQRNIDAWAERLRGIFTGECLHQLPLIEAAMGRQTQALVLQLDAACRAADDLAAATARRSLTTAMNAAASAAIPR